MKPTYILHKYYVTSAGADSYAPAFLEHMVRAGLWFRIKDSEKIYRCCKPFERLSANSDRTGFLLPYYIWAEYTTTDTGIQDMDYDTDLLIPFSTPLYFFI